VIRKNADGSTSIVPPAEAAAIRDKAEAAMAKAAASKRQTFLQDAAKRLAKLVGKGN
jgi:hypothetical protein